MRILIAILLPPLALLFVGKWFQAFLCLILQVSLIGWLPAAIWAVVVVNNHNSEQRIIRQFRKYR